jgi:hypothetical protein
MIPGWKAERKGKYLQVVREVGRATLGEWCTG